jgi:hypothetical protein
MKPGTIGKSYQGPSLPQRYYTPAEAQIPTLPGLQKHKPVSVILDYRQQRIAESSSSSNKAEKYFLKHFSALVHDVFILGIYGA